MAIANCRAVLPADVSRVWETVTSPERYSWRSDLAKTEILNDRQFVEYTKEGYATTFTVTREEPCKRWEFDMENSRMKGRWVGVFTQAGDRTEIDFTEDVTAKSVLLKPCVKRFLKKQQALFIADLKRALEEKRNG